MPTEDNRMLNLSILHERNTQKFVTENLQQQHDIFRQ